MQVNLKNKRVSPIGEKKEIMTNPVSPWYNRDLKFNNKTKPPSGFGIYTRRDDINEAEFLRAIDNQSVPREAVLCYANLVCDSIKHKRI